MAGERTRYEAQLPMFVIDVLRYDIEPLSSIVKMLNNRGSIGWREFWPRDFTEAEVIKVLEGLIREEIVMPYQSSETENLLVPSEDNARELRTQPEKYWFLLTEKGRQAWEEWEDYPADS